MSFITKDQFIYGIVTFLVVFTGALYLFKRNDLDTDAQFTMITLVAIIIISIVIKKPDITLAKFRRKNNKIDSHICVINFFIYLCPPIFRD